MKITPETATTLGGKLAALELSDEEGALLAVLLRDDAEVAGFGYTEVEWTVRSKVLDPLPARWKVEEAEKGDSYLIITMEN